MQTATTDTSIEMDGAIVPAVVEEDEYSYTIVVKNFGPATAYDVTLWDALPDSVTINDYSIPYTSQINDTLFWLFDSLASSDSIIVTISLVVADSLPSEPFPLINEAGLRAANDTNPADNYATDIVYGIKKPVIIPTDWEPLIEATPAIADIGDKIRVRVLIPVPVRSWDIRIHPLDPVLFWVE